PGALCDFQLRSRAMVEARAENSRSRRAPFRGSEAAASQTYDRETLFQRLPLYWHGSLRAGGRRTRRRATRKNLAAEFPGLQHARRSGHLRVWDVVHLASGGALLAKPKGAAGVLQGAGRGETSNRQGLSAHGG